MGIRKTTTKSDEDVIGNFMDSFTSVNTSRYINTKMTEINQRVYSESILNRKQLKGKELGEEAPETMLGMEAISQGYADKVGSYYDILRS